METTKSTIFGRFRFSFAAMNVVGGNIGEIGYIFLLLFMVNN
jgi:hypothetical protein